MSLSITDLLGADREAQRAALLAMSDEELAAITQQTLELRGSVLQQNQLQYYVPASDEARKIHLSTAKQLLATGGNRSSKTTTVLADAVICMTGVVPDSLADVYPREKLRCPMRGRLMVNSLTNTWEPVIKPKLQWNRWNGRGIPGGPYGHWGFIPPRFLIKGKWEESWSEKNRTLTLTCGCTLQVMSYDQDVEDLQGTSLHLVINDEGPPHAHYRENLIRTGDVAGRVMTAMTPPDDESAAWDAAWIYDQLYEKGLPGPAKDPDIDAFCLFTEQNRILDMVEVEKVTRGLTPEQKEVRTKGRFLHLSGRIYKDYTDRPQWWCFQCSKVALTVEPRQGRRACATCAGTNVVEFQNFVEPFAQAYDWPVVYLLDPHPRKPNMMSWVAVSPADDYYQIAELDVDGSPEEVRTKVREVEDRYRLHIAKRIMDPNMGGSPAHSAGRRHITVKDEFDAVGLRCDSADDDFMVGKNRLANLLRPDPRTNAPRLHIFNTCPITNRQMLRYVWSEWARYTSDTKDPKPQPMAKNDDYPTLLRYFANAEPTHASLSYGTQIFRRAAIGGARRGY